MTKPLSEVINILTELNKEEKDMIRKHVYENGSILEVFKKFRERTKSNLKTTKKLINYELNKVYQEKNKK